MSLGETGLDGTTTHSLHAMATPKGTFSGILSSLQLL